MPRCTSPPLLDSRREASISIPLCSAAALLCHPNVNCELRRRPALASPLLPRTSTTPQLPQPTLQFLSHISHSLFYDFLPPVCCLKFMPPICCQSLSENVHHPKKGLKCKIFKNRHRQNVTSHYFVDYYNFHHKVIFLTG